MNLEYAPLLAVQRDLYRLPRGMERFQAYLRTLIDDSGEDMRLPLAGMNPMGKEHLPVFLDALLALDADGVGAEAMRRAAADLEGEAKAAGSYRVCLVVCDDLMGGWTNRWSAELAYRADQRAYYKRGWIAALLWTTDAYAPAKAADEVAACVYRAAYVERHGQAKTLDGLLRQEGFAQARAESLLRGAGAATAGNPGRTAENREPTASEVPAKPERPASFAADLGTEELDYTREVLRPFLGATDVATWIAALFGDGAAKQLGHAPLGLSARAGLRLARHDARQNQFLALK